MQDPFDRIMRNLQHAAQEIADLRSEVDKLRNNFDFSDIPVATSFPTNKPNNQVIFNVTEQEIYRYNSADARWYSTIKQNPMVPIHIGTAATSGWIRWTANGAILNSPGMRFPIRLLYAHCMINLDPTHNASNYWTVNIYHYNATTGASTLLYAFATSVYGTLAVNTWVAVNLPIVADYTTTAIDQWFYLHIVKTGAPGFIDVRSTLFWQEFRT
jgi:hypothetical protein